VLTLLGLLAISTCGEGSVAPDEDSTPALILT
jgi:hypothetical protein